MTVPSAKRSVENGYSGTNRACIRRSATSRFLYFSNHSILPASFVRSSELATMFIAKPRWSSLAAWRVQVAESKPAMNPRMPNSPPAVLTMIVYAFVSQIAIGEGRTGWSGDSAKVDSMMHLGIARKVVGWSTLRKRGKPIEDSRVQDPEQNAQMESLDHRAWRGRSASV